MKKVLLALAVLVSGPALGGCATVLNGVHQGMPFQSDPAGATIRLVSGPTCETPCELQMRRGHDSMVTISRDGYEPAHVYIQSRLGGQIAGNLIAGGLIGGIVDGSNGASNRLYPNPVYVRLAPLGSGREAELLDRNGRVISTVAAYNAEVEADVMEGLRARGLAPAQATQPTTQP
jgi:hypothetical protein